MPWSAPTGGPTENPFALLTALRRNASRISLYCHAGAIKVPARHVPLLAFLEDAVHPVTPPRRGGVFHPKLWLLRFVANDEPIQYRLLVLSRNLTFDRSWDVALALDGALLDRKRGIAANRSLSDFIAALPGMATSAGHPVIGAAADRARLLSDEIRRVEWTLPDGFDFLEFHPIGHDGKPNWPVVDLYRLLVISPFVGGDALAKLRAETREELILIGRFEELSKLDADALAHADETAIFDDPSSLLELDSDPTVSRADETEQPPTELSGLHAKVFAGERYRRAVVYVGSANATAAAFDLNVEFLVELEGARPQHGVDSLRKALDTAGLLRPFVPGDEGDDDDEVVELDRRLDRVAHDLASGALSASVEHVAEGRWRPALLCGRAVNLDGLRLEARPLSEQTYRRVDVRANPCCVFAPTGLASITPFFALRLTGRASSSERQLDVVVRLVLDGAPEGRAEAVTAELLSDRDRLLRFILLLLADDGNSDRVLAELEQLLSEPAAGRTGVGSHTESGLPLLEPLLRSLHRAPERLDEIEQLIKDLRVAGAGDDLLPKDFDAIWRTVSAVRQDQ